ncbi:MAG: DUF3429 domain-containing protein [Rickettsiales bacterium]|nr:DUF3429 domain-containing protein [Rickettsiales bacterium]
MGRILLTLTIIAISPFVALSVAIAMGHYAEPAQALMTLFSYAAVIITFTGGIHWGIAIQQYSKNTRVANTLALESIVPVAIAWSLVFFHAYHIQLLILSLVFTLIWVVDSLLYNMNIIPQWFFTIRCVVTPIMLASLYIVYFGII